MLDIRKHRSIFSNTSLCDYEVCEVKNEIKDTMYTTPKQYAEKIKLEDWCILKIYFDEMKT